MLWWWQWWTFKFHNRNISWTSEYVWIDQSNPHKMDLGYVLHDAYLSQCSASCGHGFETREFRCPAPHGVPFFDCGPSPPDEQRPCRGTFRRHDPLCYKPKPCRRDASVYCSLTNLLGRYCVIPGFRKLCCKSCSLIMNMLPNEITQIWNCEQ